MKLTDAQKHIVQEQHDSFCKTIMRNEARDCYREDARFNNDNLAIVLLEDGELDEIAATDEHKIESKVFSVYGFSVPVNDIRISRALASLSKRKRDIVLLHFYLEMSDREIANTLGISPSTVHHHKTTALDKLRKYLGGA